MKFGVQLFADYLYAFDLMKNVVGIMNEYDYSSIWLGDQRLLKSWPRTDTLATLPALAMLTNKMTIGTNVLLAPFYHPLFLAEYWSTLDVISGGRAILGIGAGYRPKPFMDYEIPRPERFSRLEETIEIIKRLWTEPSINFSGRHFNFKDVSLTLKPIQKPRPPIWVGATAKPGFERAARFGDACCVASCLPINKYKKYMKIYRKALRDSGKDVSKIEMPVLIASACVAKNRDIARMAAEEFMLRKHRDYAKRKGHRLYELLKKEGRDASELTFNDIEDEVFLGGPDETIEIVEKLKGLGANHIIFRLAWAGLTMEQSVLDSVKLIGEKVIPYFSQQ